MLAACLFCSVILLTAIKRKVKRLSADTETGAFCGHIENLKREKLSAEKGQ